MKILYLIRYIALIVILGIIVHGLFMMAGQFMGLTYYDNHLLVVGLALILLSELIKVNKLEFIIFALGVFCIIINY